MIQKLVTISRDTKCSKTMSLPSPFKIPLTPEQYELAYNAYLIRKEEGEVLWCNLDVSLKAQNPDNPWPSREEYHAREIAQWEEIFREKMQRTEECTGAMTSEDADRVLLAIRNLENILAKVRLQKARCLCLKCCFECHGPNRPKDTHVCGRP